ncbi:MFS transporter [Amycolatopsis pigmentata]|uniref:MFS transporter n=1 Tax=Amycolatopsis pigmentata TaxID=450801 RepID=A0ABW5FQ77_9PSEU
MTTEAAVPAPHGRVVSNILRGSIGNLIEWYDWYAYAAFSVYFAATFFPKGDTTAQLLDTAGVFAVGFLMRPIGGWILGRYADRFGRRAALTLSVTLMAAGSLLIALTPGYGSIGLVAPILLLLARLVQGISVGGEYSTSATYMSEVATRSRRGYYSSYQYVTLIAGQLVALAVQIVLQQVLTPAEMAGWGWRIAFGIGALGALIVLWLRRGMDESESFEAAKKADRHGRNGTIRELARHPREFALVLGLTMGGTLFFYTYTTYLQKFMVNTSGISKPTAAWINFCALVVFVVLQPIFGALSDRVGRRPMLIAFGVLGTLITVPSLTLLAHTKNPVAAFGLMTVPLAVSAAYTSISAVVKAELFPTTVRALGVGLPYSLAVAIFGGTAEYIALWFKQAGHESWFFYYVTAVVFASLLVYLKMRDTATTSWINADATAEHGAALPRTQPG